MHGQYVNVFIILKCEGFCLTYKNFTPPWFVILPWASKILFRRWSQDVTTSSKSLLKINITFCMSVIPILIHPEVSFHWWPKLLLWTMWRESTLKTPWGTSIVKSPFHVVSEIWSWSVFLTFLGFVKAAALHSFVWRCIFFPIAVIAATTSE